MSFVLSHRAGVAVAVATVVLGVSGVAGVAVASPTATIGRAESSEPMVPCVHMSAVTREQMMARHMEMPGPSACVAFRPFLTMTHATARATSSTPRHPVGAVLRSGKHAAWLSGRLTRSNHLPQSVTIALPATQTVTGLAYTAPKVTGSVGTVARFRVTISLDGHHFGAPVAIGRWQDNLTQKQVSWSPRALRAVRLTVLSVSPSSATRIAISRLRLTGVRSHTTATPMATTAAATNPSVVGSWGTTIGFPIVPVAAALVPGNRMVIWSADSADNFDSSKTGQTYTTVWNLSTGAISSSVVTGTNHNMFCPGVAILPDGRILVSGGIGDTRTSIYDPQTNSWSAGPQMNIGRGYQSDVTLSDGRVFTIGGSWSGGTGGKTGEVYAPGSGWSRLTGVPADPTYTADSQGVYRQDNHTWLFATSNGNVFHAGPSKRMNWISTSGSGSITNAGQRGAAADAMNGDAVMYDVNKILYDGGAPQYQDSDATSVAGTIDISGGLGATPKVSTTASMSNARGFHNSVVLPNGNVFTVGGETHPIPFDDKTSVLTPELWNPRSGTWTSMATGATPRNYHSVAMLLPDGTVFSGGGGLCGTCAVNHPDGQIFSPPYLFNADGTAATRPVITSAPATASNGQTISVTTGGPVTSFVMVRYGEATHTVDTDQRRIPLTIASQSGNTYRLTIPSDAGTAIPGPYMLFALNSQGTPSVSTTVTVSSSSTTTPPAITSAKIVGTGSKRCLDNQSTTADGGAVVISDCTGKTNQRWTLTSSGQLTNGYAGKCLDVSGAGTKPGTAVIQWPCNGQTNQQWTYRSDTHTFVGNQSGLCLDVNNGATANGSKVIIWTCNGQTNQQWTAA